LSLLPSAEPLGITLDDLSRQVRQAFYGAEAQRIQRGRDDIRVMVRFPRDHRTSLADLDNLRIRTPGGGEVPFYAVARIEQGRGYATINRSDRRRVINVTADVDDAVANENEILADLRSDFLPVLLGDYPGLSYDLEGVQREQNKTITALFTDGMFALVLIYALLAVPLRSYGQPLIIMAVIPFGVVGAIAGHLIMRMDLSMMSVFGVVALSGVVVNSSLVLVHYINQRRNEGIALSDVVREAGVARFRPIALTSMTTFAGLTPLLLEGSVSAQFLIPMAISLAFGVVFASSISLFLVPSLYLILEDVKHGVSKWIEWISRPLPSA
jgi:multidrug efflux pump subunit AcrB